MKIRTDFLLLAKPTIEEEERKAVDEVLCSGWLTTGPKVKEFEEKMQQYLQCEKAIALTSCTGGLHIALAAVGVSPGDEVIVPVYTFVACAHVVEWLGAKPVFVDVDKDTFNIDHSKIEEAITSKTKAIMPVHFAGHACNMDKILEIAKKHHLFVVEDAAHAIGTEYRGKKIGTHGDATVFSFYATKTMTTAEGGMITTNNKVLGEKLKRFSYFGVDKDAYGRYSDRGTWYYEVIEKGFKYNMDNIHGALGVEQLKKVEGFIARRRILAALYNALLRDVPGIVTPVEKEYTKHSYHLYPILLDVDNVKITRADFIEKLREYKIGSSVHFIPLHLHPYYQKKYDYKQGNFPIAEYIYDHEVSLPLFPSMTAEDVKYVVDAIKEIIEKAGNVQEKKERSDSNRLKKKVITIGNKTIGGDNPCFTIAEIGINFNGSLEKAMTLIDSAVEAGCDAVKFQAFTAKNLYSKTAGNLDWEDKKNKYSYSIYDNVKQFELPKEWVPLLKQYCEKNGIIFFSSICDEEQADYYDTLGVPLFKTTSYAITHLPLMEHIAKKRKPLIISTGGATLEEIREAYETARKYNDKIIILHCMIKYPAPLSEINMNVLETLQNEFPEAVIGYSDHSAEPADAPIAAIYKKAKVIEKHITLDKKMPGPDHFFALEPEELKQMVRTIKETEKKIAQAEKIDINPLILGNSEKIINSSEKYLREFAYQTIITSGSIKEGETISVNILRPGKLKKGLPPKDYPSLTNGSFMAKHSFPEGEIILWGDVEKTRKNGAEAIKNLLEKNREKNNSLNEEKKTYIIAEIASAHCGDIHRLKTIIKKSAETGVNAIKFQVFNVDYFVSKFHPNYENNKKNQFSIEQWTEIFEFSQQFNIDLWADVFDEESANLADKYVCGFKLHSTDITNNFMIEHIAKKGKPIILATGGASLEELKKAVQKIEDLGNNQIILTQGFQAYPTDISKVNLKRIEILKKEFPQCILGYHDHTDAESVMKIILPVASVAYGAKVIEKHITDDRSLKGFDYESALNPDELKELVKAIRAFESSVGKEGFELSLDELQYRDYTKRYIVAKCPLNKGNIIQQENLAFKRSTKGITPNQYQKIVGLKTIRDLKEDESITPLDVKNKVVITLAVRLKSKRLPKKAILDIEGQTAIEHQIDRLKRCKEGEVILCTSTLEEDEQLIGIAQKKGIKYFAGDPDDVMDRFVQCAEREEANIVVRTTGDCPLIDPEIVDKLIIHHLKTGADYTGIEDVPIGFEAEVINVATLKEAKGRVKDPKDTEFMTWFIKDPFHFKVEILPIDEAIKCNYRMTLDTPQDLQAIREVFKALYPKKRDFTIGDIVDFLNEHPEVVSINMDYQQIKRPPKLAEMREHKTVFEEAK